MGGVNEKLQRGITAGMGLFELLDEPVEVEQGARTLTRADGAIEFRDLHFRYDGQEQDALRGINLTIKPGQTVAFVGKSGSGMSTLLAMLQRFYDADGGAVLVDGHDVREYRMPSLRDKISLVDQQAIGRASWRGRVCQSG